MIALLSGLPAGSRAGELKGQELDDDRQRAAAAVFGVGIDIDHDKSSDEISLAYQSGTLDDATMQRFISDYYRPEVDQNILGWASELAYAGLRRYHLDYVGAVERGGEAWLMAEPYARGQLCKQVGSRIEDEDQRSEVMNWCEYAAVVAAGLSEVEFRGKPVTWPGEKNYAGDLEMMDTLWPARNGVPQVLLVLSGPYSIKSSDHLGLQYTMAQRISSESGYHAKAQAIVKKLKTWIDDQEKQVAKLDKKQMGKKGGKVVFADRPFDKWDAVEAVTTASSCKKLYWKAFGPTAKKARGKYYDWQMKVDGTSCQSDFFGGAGIAIARGGIGQCSKQLDAAGSHTIVVEIWATKYVKTGETEVRVRGDRLEARDRETSERTKMVGKGSITCETAGR